MKTKKAVLINDAVEYIITIKDTDSNVVYKMKRSDADFWVDSLKNEKVAKLIDNGDDEVIVSINSVATIELHYSELWELHILLTEFFSKPNHSKFNLVKVN
jgi:hypothetical protein